MKTLRLSVLLIASGSMKLHAQGCAQCRDNMQATPPATQIAYRHAIELLALSGVGVFAGGVFMLRRFR